MGSKRMTPEQARGMYGTIALLVERLGGEQTISRRDLIDSAERGLTLTQQYDPIADAWVWVTFENR